MNSAHAGARGTPRGRSGRTQRTAGQIVRGGPRSGVDGREAKCRAEAACEIGAPFAPGGEIAIPAAGITKWMGFKRPAPSNRALCLASPIPSPGRTARARPMATERRIPCAPPTSALSRCANACGIAPLTLAMRTSRARALTNRTAISITPASRVLGQLETIRKCSHLKDFHNSSANRTRRANRSPAHLVSVR
jgi:hypothetical protein